MVGRRSFLLASVPAAWGLAAAGRSLMGEDAPQSASRAVFEMITAKLEFGPQSARLLNWLENRVMPFLLKQGFGPMGIFTVNVGSHIPSVVILRSHASLAAMQAAWERVAADSTFGQTLDELEAEGPAFVSEDYALLEATTFCPPLTATPPDMPQHKVYELRIYKSATYRQHEYLHERFAGGEIDVFHKSGIHPVLYADTVFGPERPNMVYLIPFDDLAQRERAWSAFGASPDWQKLRDDSIRRGGEIVRDITNMFLTPASFSMLR